MQSMILKRIMIFGRPGSGKSTFAIWVSEILRLPLHHLDKYFYVNNWIERDYNEFLKLQQNIVNSECWIVDGNSTRSLKMRMKRADLVLYFNFPKVICAYRIFKRFLKPNKSFDDRAPGCKEKICFSLLKYMWGFEERVAEDIKVLKERYPQAMFIEIRSDNDLNKLKNELLGMMHPNLLLKKFDPTVSIIEATMDDYPCIQNMARFYLYDLSRECGSISSDWAIPENGLYESFDFKNYFEEPSRKAYLVKVYDEIAGFVLLNQATEEPSNNWNMGEFFIIAKFQGRGIGVLVAHKIWNIYPGKWEVSVIPSNKSALKFWEKAISEYTCGTFNQQIKEVSYDEHCPRRIIFEFDTQNSIHKKTIKEGREK